MSKTNFENLRVYLLSEKLSDILWETVIKWDAFAKNSLGSQLVRSSDSIGANIAEGTGRGSYLDNKRFAKIARASLYETKHWLRRAYQRNLINKEEVEVLKNIIDELAPRLNSYINSIGTQADIVH
jgi:four helix bundle protein